MKKISFVLFVIVLLSSCAKTIFLMPQYTNMKIESKTLVVANMDMFVGNPKDVTDDLGDGNPKKVYQEYFEFNFKGKMSQLSTFREVNFVEITNIDEFTEKTFEIDKKESIYMNIPEDGQITKTDSVYGDFVLFIQEFQVYRNDGTSGSAGVYVANAGGKGGSWVGGGGGSFPDLRTTFNFVLWDNENKNVVSYGKVNCPTTFAFAMTDQTWDSSITNLVKKILKNTPFENFPESMK